MTGDRAAAVDAAVGAWAADLRRADDIADVELDLAAADPTARAALLAGRTVRLRALFREPADHATSLRALRAIRDRGRELVEEHGLPAVVLSIGAATWPALWPATRPVLRLPLRVTARSASEDDFDLAAGAPIVDAALVEALRASGVTPAPAAGLDRVRDCAADLPGFVVGEAWVVGIASEAGARAAAELESSLELLAASDPVAALAGHPLAAAALGEPLDTDDSDDSDADRIDPAREYPVVDADPQQQAAINAVLAGRHIAVEGAPGTGRSATVVAAVGALIAAGRSVLVVAEKRAALSTLLERLVAVGLGHLVVDGADETGSRLRIAAAVVGARDPLPAEPAADPLRRRLAESGDRLSAHSAALHEPRPPWQESVYGIQAALLVLPSQAQSRVRLRGETLAALHGETLASARAVVGEWAGLGGASLTAVDTPWYGGQIGTAAQAREARETATTLAEGTYPQVRVRLERALAEAGLAPAPSVADWADALDLLAAVAETERVLFPAVWSAPLQDLVAATADRDWRREHDDRLGLRARSAARREAQALWRVGKPQRAELHDALVAARGRLAAWARRALRRGSPRTVPDLAETRARYAGLRAELDRLQGYLPDRDLAALTPDVLDKTLRGLAADPALERLPRLAELTSRAAEFGLRPLLLELTARRVPVELAPSVAEYARLTSLLEHIRATDPRYGEFDGAALRRTAADFRADDARHVATNGHRVALLAAERLGAAAGARPEQVAFVATAPGLRPLLESAPEITLAAAPCWVVSPLAVSALLPLRRIFDVVIVEEANLVAVAPAVGALARAGVAVLVGDRRALPPVRLGPDAEPAPPVPSVLDVLAPHLPDLRLRTLHRLCDERLVSFAAATSYRGALLTRPSAIRTDPISHVPVPHRAGAPGRADSVPAEVQKVVGLIIDQAVRRPAESFGVITISAGHAERIAAALRVALVGRPELSDRFSEDAAERFFIAPSARVQGEVRDVIFFSTGFGKTAEGSPAYRFGPLDVAGGERLLTVGLTRARRRLTVITSLTAAELDPARLPSRGARLLRAALVFAESAERRRTAYANPPPPDALDLDLRRRLRAAGLPVVPDFGTGPARIDLALAHPTDPDRLVLAVETDGPRDRALATVRNRERLHPEHLEALGWTRCRVWSTDWFRDPATELARIIAAYDEAVARIDSAGSVG